MYHRARGAAAPANRIDDRRRFALLLTLGHLAVLALLMAVHAPWRDEMQAWVIVRDSGSLASLLDALRYEGHPLLWYLLLWPLARITPDPAAMQVLHVVIASAVIYVVARWSPFDRWLVALLAFGYFFIFEFAVPSRAYALGALLLFVACALFVRRRESYLPIAVSLALLANTSAYGVIMALAFSIALLADWLTRAESRRLAAAHPVLTIVSVLLVGAAGMAAVLQVQPPPDAAFRGAPVEREEAVSPYALGTTGSLVWASYVPVARGGLEAEWGSNVLLDRGRPQLALALALSMLFVAVVVLLVARDPPALSLYLSGTAIISLVAYFLFVGSTRHFGHLWLLALAALWLAWESGRGWSLPPALDRLSAALVARRRWILGALLVAQAAAALQHVQLILRRPLSGVPAAARLVRETASPAEPVAVAPAFLGAGASAELRRPVHMIELDRTGSFTPWGEFRPKVIEVDTALALLRPLLDAHESVILIVNVPMPERWQELQTRELGAFVDAVDPQERVRVYRVRRAPEFGAGG